MSEVSELYEAFSAPVHPATLECSCGCDDRLHLPGGAADLKCFLPPLFELWAKDALQADPEPFFERLHDYGFMIWPAAERDAVKAFLYAQWDAALREGSEWYGGFCNAAMLIECIAWLFDPQPLLQRWALSQEPNARAQLRSFAGHNLVAGEATLNTAYERPLFASRIERWLTRLTI